MKNLFNPQSEPQPILTGLVQAVGVGSYVALLVTIITRLEKTEVRINETVGGMIFLTTFVVSALICSALVLGYPATLALQGKVKQAVMTVVWTVLWLVAVLAIMVLLALLLQHASWL